MVIMPPVKKAKQSAKQLIASDNSNLSADCRYGDDPMLEEEEEQDVSQELKIIAQEVRIVKSLACNDLHKRTKQMKRLRSWLQLRSQSSFPFTQEDFMRIWKGLYYNMWYSDKPLVQEELAEDLGKLLECFRGNLQFTVDFFGAFLKTMCIEWFGIDQWRIDKFLMLTRRMLRHVFLILKSNGWSTEALELFNKHATETVLVENSTSKGLTMHYLDIFFEELAKVSEGEISSDQVALFVTPFVVFMTSQRDFQLISHCRNRIFYHLLYQSELGREYSEKYNAWKEMGFPTKHINDLEKCEEEVQNHEDIPDQEGAQNEAAHDKHWDPRAGNVDVFMPVLPLDAKPIIKIIENFLYKEECATKRRKVLKKLLEILKTYDNGEFPLGVKTMPRFEAQSDVPLIHEKVMELENLENELYGVDRKLKQLTKRKRRKLLKSLNYDTIDESNYEQKLEKAIPKDYLAERKKKSQKAFMNGWIEEALDENDLKPQTNGVVTNKTEQSKKQKKRNKEQEAQVPQKKQKRVEKAVEKCATEKEVIKAESVEEVSENTSLTSKRSPNRAQTTVNNTKSKISDAEVKEVVKSTQKQSKVLKISDPGENLKPKETKVLKISDPGEDLTPKSKKKSTSLLSTPSNDWDEPLAEGEIEYFVPSRKQQLKKANADLVPNPLAKRRLSTIYSTPVNHKKSSLSAANTPTTPGGTKRVKIALKHNTSQNPAEYIQQIKSSPNIPYDAKKKPGKGLLKPNSMPSPINPFYKKKIGLKLLNDTI